MTGSRWTLVALGLWVAASAFMGFGSEGYLWSNLSAGLMVFLVGVPLVVEAKREGWIEAVLGVWLIIAAFVPGLREGAALVWDNTIAGLVIATIAFIVPRAERRIRWRPT